jgi:hypothetical protein
MGTSQRSGAALIVVRSGALSFASERRVLSEHVVQF